MSKEEFETSVYELIPPDPEIQNFISYWTETDLKGKKMRFEAQKFFDIKRRFGTWKRNSIKFNQSTNKTISTLSAYEQAKVDMGLS